MRCWLWLATILSVACASGGGVVRVDGNGDLSVTPLAGRAVLVQGVDVSAASVAVDRRLRALEAALQLEPGPVPVQPLTAHGAANAPRIGHDPLGNLLLIPAPSNACESWLYACLIHGFLSFFSLFSLFSFFLCLKTGRWWWRACGCWSC